MWFVGGRPLPGSRRLACGVVLPLAVVALLSGAMNFAAGATAAALTPQVYWSNYNSTIGRANVDGSGVNQSFINDPGHPLGLAVDGEHIYWTDFNYNTIARANLDGSGVNRSFISGAADPRGVAVDGQHVYWTNTDAGTIGRANLDGSGVNQTFISGASVPYGVAVDRQHIYWTNLGSGTIGRANLDGSGANQSFIRGARAPVGLAADGQHVYWTNTSQVLTIGRANVDGSGVNQSFVITASYPDGVAVDGQHIYWTLESGTIARANLDGGGVNQSFISGAIVPYGVAVLAEPSPPGVPLNVNVTAEDQSLSVSWQPNPSGGTTNEIHRPCVIGRRRQHALGRWFADQCPCLAANQLRQGRGNGHRVERGRLESARGRR